MFLFVSSPNAHCELWSLYSDKINLAIVSGVLKKQDNKGDKGWIRLSGNEIEESKVLLLHRVIEVKRVILGAPWLPDFKDSKDLDLRCLVICIEVEGHLVENVTPGEGVFILCSRGLGVPQVLTRIDKEDVEPIVNKQLKLLEAQRRSYESAIREIERSKRETGAGNRIESDNSDNRGSGVGP